MQNMAPKLLIQNMMNPSSKEKIYIECLIKMLSRLEQKCVGFIFAAPN